MKISIVDFSGKGGIGHYAYSLYKSLREINDDTVLITTRSFEFPEEEGIFAILPSHVEKKSKIVKGFIYIVSLIKVFSFFRDRESDIIHLHETRLPLIETLLFYFLHKRKSKIVLTSHNIFRAEAHFIPFTLKRLYKTVDAIIFHSETNKDDLRERIDFKWAKMWKIIPHGNYFMMVNPVMTKEKARKLLEIDNDKYVILCFGFIRKYKGLDIIINAVSKLRLSFRNVVLVIAGKEIEHFKKYKDMIKRLDLQNFVHSYPYYIPNDEISTFFLASDVVVLPYKRIFQSGVIQLAFAHAKPVIASELGGIPDLVNNGKTGFLVKPGDPHALASALEKFFSLSEKKRYEMGLNGRYLAQNLYSWKDIAKKTLDFYKDIK